MTQVAKAIQIGAPFELPGSLVRLDPLTLVLSPATVTLAFGTAAPDESVIVPTSAASTA